MSRTFSSAGLRTGAARPNGSRRCGATGRTYSATGGLAWRAAGMSDGGLAYCGGGTRSGIRRRSLLSRPARSVSELSTGCFSRAEAWQLLCWFNEHKSIPVWSDGELLHKLEDAFVKLAFGAEGHAQ